MIYSLEGGSPAASSSYSNVTTMLVKISSVKHLRTLDPYPYAKEDSLQLRSVLVRLLQTLSGGDSTPFVAGMSCF